MHPEANSHWLKLQLQVHISVLNFTKAYSCQIWWSMRWAQRENGWVETFLSCIFTESTTEQSLDVTTAEQDRLSEPLETTTSISDDGATISDAVTSTSDTLIADVVTSTSYTSTGKFVIASVCIAVVSNPWKQFRFNLRLQAGAVLKRDIDCSAGAHEDFQFCLGLTLEWIALCFIWNN